jgi:DNA-binding Lrp family transcriptional regulator
VLANVQRGRVAYLVLNQEQKRSFRDPEGKVALDVLRHLLGARPPNPERFPLAEQTFQAVARRIGYELGQKRCRRMIRRLRTTGVIARRGHYRQPYRNGGVRSGFCVRLYVLGRRLRLLPDRPLSKRQRPVGTPTPVKPSSRRRWWQHPLFGDIHGLPPPDLPRHRAQRMVTLDEVSGGWGEPTPQAIICRPYSPERRCSARLRASATASSSHELAYRRRASFLREWGTRGKRLALRIVFTTAV